MNDNNMLELMIPYVFFKISPLDEQENRNGFIGYWIQG